MKLDFVALIRFQCVMDGDRCVSVCRRVDDDCVRFSDGFLYPLDYLALKIRLLEFDLYAEFGADSPASFGDFVQRFIAVNFGLACAKQVQIGAIDDGYFHGRANSAAASQRR